MAPRLDLQSLLVDTLGSSNVYFQPPSTVTMQYPAIVYKWDTSAELFANNNLYKDERRYLVTVIDKNPDSSIPDAIKTLPKCSFDRAYSADNLNHFVYKLFF